MKRKVTLAVAASVVALMPVMAQAANKLIVKDAAGTTDKFVVTDTGRIGIGTNAPDAALHIKGTVFPSNAIKVEGDPVNGGGGYIGYLVRPGGLPVQGERLGFIYLGSINDQGQNPVPLHAAGMKAVAEAAWTTASTPALFAFETTPSGSTTRLERMRITSVGNVGIGATSISQKLEVYGGIRVYPVSASPNTESPTLISKPSCNASTRGTLWFTPSATTDVVEICAKVGGSYAFKAITLAP